MAPDQTIYCADDDAHTVSQVTVEGAVLRVFGTPGQTPGFMSGKPFCRCTHSAITPQGDVLISDGYGNARIHKYSADGTLISSWGSPGVEPGQFNLPHNLVCDADGWVYVADRENHRIQVFDTDGNVHDVWHNLHRPSALSMSPEGLLYVGEIGPYLSSNRGTPNLGPRVSILDTSGSVVARLQVTPSAGAGPGQFVSPHSIAVDSHGDIYVGEVSGIAWPRLFPGTEKPADLSTIHKYVKVQETN
jgi:DNA-binding beta-propeller fold protein YncE